MKIIKLFNCEHIYKHKKLNYYSEFASIILETFFQIFLDEYSEVKKGSVKKSIFAEMLFSFLEWLNRYDINKIKLDKTYEVNSIFDKRNPSDYMKAVLTYLSLMSDHYAISLYNKVISFR